MKLRVLDLFSGIGGFSLGLERTGGFETVAFCEIEPFPRKVLAKHWPEVPCYDDVRTLTAERLAADGIAVDVICGGFPCQDLSTSGSGLGLNGERSGLWHEYARLIGEIRPRFVVVENSPELLDGWIGDIFATLDAFGMYAEWHCIPASALGAPHKRERVWIIAYASGERQPQSGRYIHSVRSAPNAYREADRFVSFFQRTALPYVCRGHDGLPIKLDGGLNAPSETGCIEGLSYLHSATNKEAVYNGASGGLWALQKADILRQDVPSIGADKSTNDQPTNDVFAVKEVPAEVLRDLPDGNAAARSPHRPRHNEQLSSEPGNALRHLPQSASCGPDRLKALGNAVVPQIPELIGRAILEARA